MSLSAVLGAGSWGTALAEAQASLGKKVLLWDRNEERLKSIAATRENAKYHPGVRLSPNIHPEPSFEKAVRQAGIVTIALPSHGVREALVRMRPFLQPNAILVCAAKGFEQESHNTLSHVAAEVLGSEIANERYAVLSGPSFAHEVIRHAPTAVTIASHSAKSAKRAQGVCQTEHLRIFLSNDVIGVEVGGALKNVVAIATGAADGLGFGLNARAALLTRSLADISRVGQKMGANPLTFGGLSGLGDLILTCTGDLSRNRQVGLKLAQGKSIRTIMKEIGQVAEGIRTAKAAYELANKLGVDTPILREMYLTLYEGKPPRQAVADLLALDPGGELE